MLIYLPVSLQRRFMMGLFVPLACLAGYAFAGLTPSLGKRIGMLSAVVLVLSVLTNLLLLLVAQHGIQTRDPLLYLTRGEAQALDWIEAHTPPDALILASPQTGLLIPAHTGRHVLYGHPYETVNAQPEELAVSQFFTHEDAAQAAEFMQRRGVDYVFYGPRERQLGELPELEPLQLVYSMSGVEIYQVVW
jgi:hypothetical protein